jgi:hypothetical protein
MLIRRILKVLRSGLLVIGILFDLGMLFDKGENICITEDICDE